MKTSAKSGKTVKKPRRVSLICPARGERFTLNYAEYRKHVRAGTRPTNSCACAWARRKMQAAEKAKQEITNPAGVPACP
jgi:hypothetical protein